MIVNICWYPRVCILGSFINDLLLLIPEYNWPICFMPGVKYVWFIVNDLWYFRGWRVMFITWFVGGNRLHWLGIHLGRALYHYVPYKIRAYGIINSSQIIKSTYNSGIIENLCTTFYTRINLSLTTWNISMVHKPYS